MSVEYHTNFTSECTILALDQLATMFKPPEGGIPGLGQLNIESGRDIVNQFIFYRGINARDGHEKQLSPIQQLQVLEIVLSFFRSSKNAKVVAPIFHCMFEGNLSAYQQNFLNKLLSMAIAVKTKPVLDAAGQWIQDHGCGSNEVVSLTKALVQDYCLLVAGNMSRISVLPKLSTLFTCDFIAALTEVYHWYNAKDPAIPLPLLDLITEWVSGDVRLCLSAVQPSTTSMSSSTTLWTKPRIHTPLPGLLSWCVHSPILLTDIGIDQQKYQMLFSQLHFSLLQTLITPPHTDVIHVHNIKRIVTNFVKLFQTNSSVGSHAVQLAVDRLAQFLQVAMATGTMKCSKEELGQVTEALPSNKLLETILSR